MYRYLSAVVLLVALIAPSVAAAVPQHQNRPESIATILGWKDKRQRLEFVFDAISNRVIQMSIVYGKDIGDCLDQELLHPRYIEGKKYLARGFSAVLIVLDARFKEGKGSENAEGYIRQTVEKIGNRACGVDPSLIKKIESRSDR